MHLQRQCVYELPGDLAFKADSGSVCLGWAWESVFLSNKLSSDATAAHVLTDKNMNKRSMLSQT